METRRAVDAHNGGAKAQNGYLEGLWISGCNITLMGIGIRIRIKVKSRMWICIKLKIWIRIRINMMWSPGARSSKYQGTCRG